MAQNYTQFSFTIPATKEQANWLEALVQSCHDYVDGTAEDSDFDPDVIQCLEGDLQPDVQIEWDDSSIWFHADESGDIEFTANVIHKMLQHFDLENRLGFTWSMSCSRMRPDEFGGGAVFITKDDISYMSAQSWLSDKINDEASKLTREI